MHTNKKFYHVRAIKIEPVTSVGIGFNHIPIMDGTGSTITVSELFNIVNKYTVKAKGEITCVIFADNPLVIHVALMRLNHQVFSYVQGVEI